MSFCHFVTAGRIPWFFHILGLTVKQVGCHVASSKNIFHFVKRVESFFFQNWSDNGRVSGLPFLAGYTSTRPLNRCGGQKWKLWSDGRTAKYCWTNTEFPCRPTENPRYSAIVRHMKYRSNKHAVTLTNPSNPSHICRTSTCTSSSVTQHRDNEHVQAFGYSAVTAVFRVAAVGGLLARRQQRQPPAPAPQQGFLLLV